MEKKHLKKHLIPLLTTAKDAVPGYGPSPGRCQSRTSVALLVLLARGQQSLYGLWVHKSSGVDIAIGTLFHSKVCF